MFLDPYISAQLTVQEHCYTKEYKYVKASEADNSCVSMGIVQSC